MLKSCAKTIDFTSILAKIYGKTLVNPELPSLKYGSPMEDEAIKTFKGISEKRHKNAKIEKCGNFSL